MEATMESVMVRKKWCNHPLRTNQKILYYEIEKLVESLIKCNEKQDDYTEKHDMHIYCKLTFLTLVITLLPSLFFFFPVAQQPNLGLGCLIAAVSRSRTIRNTQSVGLLWTCDQPKAEAATCTTHNTQKR
jgi:hypothetical protein